MVEGSCERPSGSDEPTGGGTYTYEAHGFASGPYPGTFTETGSFTIGTIDEEFLTDQWRGQVTDFDAEFTITGPNGTVVGSKRYDPDAFPGTFGGSICHQHPSNPAESIGQINRGGLAYEATITPTVGEAYTDTGQSGAGFNFCTEGLSCPSDPGEVGQGPGFNFTESFIGSVLPPLDSDTDGVPDASDNCPLAPNAGQEDADNDGVGDACDDDADNDGVPDGTDNCPNDSNPGQEDADNDGQGDACDSTPTGPDTDGDGVPDDTDNCPNLANPGQTDTDGDGEGDGCDPDDPEDSDGDGLYDVIEIWLGCDPHDDDTDDDGIGDRIEILLGTNPTLADSDPDDDEPNDGSYLVNIYGHRCGCGPDDDADGDGVVTWVELKYGTDPGDPDSDGAGGFSSDIDYIWHLCGCKPVDEDGDGIPSMVKKFYGGGSALEIIRRCGCMPWKKPGGGGGIWVDFRYVGGPYDEPDDPDGDGIDTVIEIWLGCDPEDEDTDGDGLNDLRELELGTDPTKEDTDGDGMNDGREIELGCDPLDPDSDDDGVLDGSDNCPTTWNPNQADDDEDGIGNACDTRDDRPQCKVTNGGQITTQSGDKANFGANAHPGNPPKGEQNYKDHGPATPVDMKSIRITDVRCNRARTRAMITGIAKLNGSGSFSYRIDVADNGEPGRNDTYRIRLSTGYDSGERKLTAGNIQIHK